jgi:putative flippase GtrA
MEATTSSAIAYLAAMMINFPLQRGFTFRSNGHVKGELLKYLAVHLVNMLISVATVHFVVQILGWPVVISVAAVVIVIPFLQFLALEAWVFSTRRQT